MYRYFGMSLVLVAALVLSTLGHSDELPDGLLCPVSAQEVDPDQQCGYREATVYFCCDKCVTAFAADPTPYATKANLQLVLTSQAVQKACPITGKETKAGVTASVGGVSVGLCCGNCQKKVEGASGDEKLELTFGDAPFEKGFEITRSEN